MHCRTRWETGNFRRLSTSNWLLTSLNWTLPASPSSATDEYAASGWMKSWQRHIVSLRKNVPMPLLVVHFAPATERQASRVHNYRHTRRKKKTTSVTHCRKTTLIVLVSLHDDAQIQQHQQLLQTENAQIPGTRLPDRLYFALRYLKSVWTGFILLFWHLEFGGGFYICGSFVHSCFKPSWKVPWRHGATILWTSLFTTY